MTDLIQSATLLLILLNPFLVIIYLVDMVEKLEGKEFARILVRAGLIAGVVFCCFAVVGDAVFSRIVHAEFASFQIFGGVVLLLIGLQFVFRGPTAIEVLRGESEHLAGAVAMPVLIGPGTISASVILGKQHAPPAACIAIVTAVVTSIAIMVALKAGHDYVRPRNARLVQRYTEVAGRITALYVGTISIDMIMQGVRTWIEKL